MVCMVVTIYAIAKNETKFVERFMNACKDADHVIVGVTHDTTDDTAEQLKSMGAGVIPVSIHPWRFDLARNLVLMHVPQDTDVCIALDIDDVIQPGWRKELEKVWTADVTLVRYPYITYWEDDAQTIPRVQMYGWKIHKPGAYTWRYPVHECLELVPGVEEKEIVVENLQVHHHHDPLKERHYQQLLDRAVQDYPDCHRMCHFRARELFDHKRYEESIVEFKRHLELTLIKSDESRFQSRALSYRYIARALQATNGRGNEIIEYMLKAVAESPYERENWVWLAEAWRLVGNYPAAYSAASNALMMNERAFSLATEEICWGDYPVKLMEKTKELMLTKWNKVRI